MRARVFATIVLVALLAGGFTTYQAYSSWLARRTDAVEDGMTKAQVRNIAGKPDDVRAPTKSEFGCSPGLGGEVWSYELTEGVQAMIVFDAQGHVACKTFSLIAV